MLIHSSVFLEHLPLASLWIISINEGNKKNKKIKVKGNIDIKNEKIKPTKSHNEYD